MPGLLSIMNKSSPRRSSDPAAMALDGSCHGSEELWKKTSCGQQQHSHGHSHTTDCQMSSSENTQQRASLLKKKNSERFSVSKSCEHSHTTDCKLSSSEKPQQRASLLKKKYGKNKPAPIRRSVSFGKVEVRICERVLGDNIACGQGPCLALGWHVCHQETLDLEEYEWKRQRESKRLSYNGSSTTAKRLSCDERTKLARQNGLSRQEIDENIKLIRKLGGVGGGKSSSNKSSGLGFLFGTTSSSGKGRDSAQQALVLPSQMRSF